MTFRNEKISMNRYLSIVTATVLTMGGLMALTAPSPTKAMAPVRPVRIAQNQGLAKSLQGKPVVVNVHASWCSACKTVAPVLSQLQQQYGGKVNFVAFDVSDRGSSKSAQGQAKQLGLQRFLQANKAQTGLVAIVDPATGQVIQQFRGNGNLKDYQSALQQAIQQVR
jgi:thiol-disulfide isomerase/thioredoxin